MTAIRKIFNTLPSDWLYQLISLSLITSMTFYLFEFTNQFQFFKEFWELNEKLYIYTFLGFQFVVKIFFYWAVFLLFKKLLFSRIKRKVLTAINEPKTREDLKDISEIKKLFVLIFGLPIELGLLEHSDFDDRIEMDEDELEVMMKGIVKWLCVFTHASFTLILVYNLSAFYIIPLLLVIFGITVVYWYGVTFLFGNISLIEKARKEIVGKKVLISTHE